MTPLEINILAHNQVFQGGWERMTNQHLLPWSIRNSSSSTLYESSD